MMLSGVWEVIIIFGCEDVFYVFMNNSYRVGFFRKVEIYLRTSSLARFISWLCEVGGYVRLGA